MTVRNIAVLSLLCMCAFARAQESHVPDLVWKKTVMRTIYLAPKEGNVKQDTSLLEMMVNAIKTGAVAAYEAYGTNFSTQITFKRLDEIINGIVDSFPMAHWITNQEIKPKVRRGFSYDSVHKFRILEDWTVNPHTGKTEIQITGIAPIRDIYDDDGVYRGSRVMFWVKYNDAHPVLERHGQQHPNQSIGALIWNDYFFSDIKPQVLK